MSHVNIGPHDLLECPFDPLHKIQAYRYTKHILKCKKNFPEKDRILETCPFNALHRYLSCNQEKHLLECPDRQAVQHAQALKEARVGNADIVVRPHRRSSEKVVNLNEEDWDEESVHKNLPPESQPRHEEATRATTSSTVSDIVGLDSSRVTLNSASSLAGTKYSSIASLPSKNSRFAASQDDDLDREYSEPRSSETRRFTSIGRGILAKRSRNYE